MSTVWWTNLLDEKKAILTMSHMCSSKLPEYSTEFLNMDGQHKRSSNSSISWSMEVYTSVSTGVQLARSCISRVTLNFTLLLICSKVFYLCFPSPSATSEPSGLYSFAFFCHFSKVFNMTDQGYFPHVCFVSDLSACHSWSAWSCILHYLRNVGTFLGWNILSSTWSRDWWP
jgi:hypothetical protein